MSIWDGLISFGVDAIKSTVKREKIDWDRLESIINDTHASMQEKMEIINRYKEEYDRFDDQKLIKKFKSSSGNQKTACRMILKERGYGQQNSK